MSDPHHDCRSHYNPSAEEVDELIARARAHELGVDFLRNGALGAVAAAFSVHAFTVDAARQKLDEADGSAE